MARFEFVVSSEDIKRVLKRCNTKFLLTIPELLPKVKEALADNDLVKVIQESGICHFETITFHLFYPQS